MKKLVAESLDEIMRLNEDIRYDPHQYEKEGAEIIESMDLDSKIRFVEEVWGKKVDRDYAFENPAEIDQILYVGFLRGKYDLSDLADYISVVDVFRRDNDNGDDFAEEEY